MLQEGGLISYKRVLFENFHYNRYGLKQQLPEENVSRFIGYLDILLRKIINEVSIIGEGWQNEKLTLYIPTPFFIWNKNRPISKH